jgi:hypothetical protein
MRDPRYRYFVLIRKVALWGTLERVAEIHNPEPPLRQQKADDFVRAYTDEKRILLNCSFAPAGSGLI